MKGIVAMSKLEKNKGKPRLFISDTRIYKDPKKKIKKKSVFDDKKTFFDSDNVESSEWDKIYEGDSAKIVADIDFDSEYDGAGQDKKKREKSSYKQKSVFEDDLIEVVGIYDQHQSNNDLPAPVIQAQAIVVEPENDKRDVKDKCNAVEDDIKDRALRIAEDFARREKIIMVGNAIYAYNGVFYVLMDDEELQRRIFLIYKSEIGQSNAHAALKNASSLLKYCIKNKIDEFPANSNIIVFQNGTLEVDTGYFRKNSSTDLVNSALGICYDPDRKKMPYTKLFLETIADGDDELYELMLQVIGYILSNDVKAKSFFYLEGVGDAGKSRFCDLIASFFPIAGANKVARVALQDLGGKFALSNLVNAKLNISEDLPDSPLSPTTVSRIKMISDANRLEAEAKYVQAFSFRPLCKLLFASNHPLRLKEYDAAFVNRVVYIPFMSPIPKDKQDKDILEKMQGELPALFNHALKAYRRLVDNGYVWAGESRFKPNIAVVSSGIRIEKEVALKRFVRECCEFGSEFVTSTADLHSAYNAFCAQNAYVPIIGDRFSRELWEILPSTITRIKIGNQKRGYRGIKLKDRFI